MRRADMGASNAKHIMTTDGATSDYDRWWHIGVTYGVTHRPRWPNTLELQFPLLISIRNNGNRPSRDFVHPQVGASPALMLRSIAARRERRRLHSPNALRCVSKHEGHAVSVLILRDARTRLQVCGTSSASALLRMRRAARTAGPFPVFSCFFADSESSIPGLAISSTRTPPRSRGAFSAPGLCIFASPTPNRGVGGAPRNVRVL